MISSNLKAYITLMLRRWIYRLIIIFLEEDRWSWSGYWKKFPEKMHSIALDCIIFDKILDPPHVAHSSKIGAYMSLLEAEFQRLVCLKGYPDNCPPRKIAPRLGLGFRSKLGLVLGLGGGGNQTIAPEKNWPLVRVRVWVRVIFEVGRKYFLGAIVLEPFESKFFQFYFNCHTVKPRI